MKQAAIAQSSMFTEHLGPVQPLTQIQENPPTELAQVAPFWQTRGLWEKEKCLNKLVIRIMLFLVKNQDYIGDQETFWVVDP